MKRSRLILFAKFATVLATLPAVIVAFSTGAPERHTGAPGDQTCTECHAGTPLNGGGGKVEIVYSGGTSYTPGERGKFTVTITDSAARRYGFEASARLASDTRCGQAGTLIAAAGTQVTTDRSVCPSSAPVQFITHNPAKTTNTYEFEWTAPAAGAGDVTVYVAGNAANGNGQPDRGDHIYTSSITLTAAAAANKPAISEGGVADAFTFQRGVASNTYIAIFGQNLASTTDTWDSTDEIKNQKKLPTTLDGVSVTINGTAAPVYSISPGQINVLAPVDPATGNVQVIVRNANGESAPVTAQKVNFLPGFYAPFAENGKLFVTARWNDQPLTILGKPGVEPRAARAFKPGDIVQFYANGLGATNPPIGAEFFQGAAALVNAPKIFINEQPVEVLGSALVSSGLYQVNARIPEIQDGDWPIVLEIAGTRSVGNVSISIKH